MEMEEIKSLSAIVNQLYKDMKDISDKHPEQPIRWDTAEIFNDLLTQAKKLINDQPVIERIQLLERPRDDKLDCHALKVVDMVARLGVLKRTLGDHVMAHQLREYKSRQQKGFTR